MTKKDDDEAYAEAVAAAVGALITSLHRIAAKRDICALCIAHAFSDYVDDLEKKGIAKHVGSDDEEPETMGGTVH